MKKLMFLLLGGILFQNSFSQRIIERDFKAQFDKYGVDGCFVMYDQTDNVYIRYNQGLCDTGYLPASTFKIPHSLIALEEKIIRDTSQVIKWDGDEWPVPSWNQDQTLKTAIKNSCLWVYIGFAEQIGIDKYHQYLDAFNYGNKDLNGPSNKFWIAGQLRISANQQVDFLKKFYNNDLPVSKRSINIVKDIIVIERTSAYKLSGKTGAGRLTGDELIMWLVGYVEKNNRPCFYALNFKTNDFNQFNKVRYDLTKDILRELKLIE